MATLDRVAVNVSITDLLTPRVGGVNKYKTPMFVINTQDAYISDVTLSNLAATGTVTPSGDPYVDADIVVKVVTAGDLGTMTFIYSIDGGTTWSDEQASSAVGTTLYELEPVSELYIQLGGTAFITDDTYSFVVEGGFKKEVPVLLSLADYKTQLTGNALTLIDQYFTYQLNSTNPEYCYIISPRSDVASSITLASSTVTGTGVFTTSGDPVNDGSLYIEIVRTAGASGTAEFQWSTDGVNYSEPTLTPTSGNSIYLTGTGVVLTFGAGTFDIGDQWVYTLVSRKASNVLTALATLTPTVTVPDFLKKFSKAGFVVIPDPTTDAQLLQLKEIRSQFQDENTFLYFFTQGAEKGSTDYVIWSDAEIAKVAFFEDYTIYRFIDKLNIGTLTSPVYVPASVTCASIQALKAVNKSPGSGEFGGLYNVIERKYEDSMLKLEQKFLDARFSIVHQRLDSTAGTYKYFFEHVQSLGSPNTSFKFVTDIAPFFKGIDICVLTLSQFLNTTIPNDDLALRNIELIVQSALNTNLISTQEASSATFIINSTIDDVRLTNKIVCSVSIDTYTKIISFDVDASKVVV